MATTDLTVAVTGPTGTFGFGLMPLLQADERISKVVGVALRPFDPAAHGWTKMQYQQGDVRSADDLLQAFRGADVVVHLAFLIVGGKRALTRAVNVTGTLYAFRAAVEAGATRFVYASSVAAYGFHGDNPVGMTEEWPVRAADRLFYAQEKAELEELLDAEATAHPEVELYLVRPPIVLGPHAVGAKMDFPRQLAPLVRLVRRGIRGLPVLVPDLPIQLIHEADVGRALLQCIVAAGPPGVYNIAADDILTARGVAREAGLLPVPLPLVPVSAAARFIAHLPLLPQAAQWVEAASHRAIMDTTRARTELHWTPEVTALESLREMLAGVQDEIRH